MKSVLKVCFVSSLILAIGITLISAFLLSRERDALLKAEEKRLSTTAELYASVVRSLMLSGEVSIAPRITTSMKAIADFEEAELYRMDGTLAFTDFTTVDFVNSRQSRMIFERTPRRTGEATSSPILKETVQSEKPRVLVLGREKKLAYWFPLLNFVECRQCHGGSPFVRGVLHLSVSTEGASQVTKKAAMIFALAGLLLLVAVCTGLVLLFRPRKAAAPEPQVLEETLPERREETTPSEPIDFLESLQFMTRRLAEDLGKKVRLEIRTNGLFPALPETIKEPLIVLVRNALDHGIEAPEKRRDLGKAEEGKIKLTFENTPERGYKIIFFDDGGGLDFPLLEARARERRLLPAGQNVPVPKETLLRLLFVPGLGTEETDGADNNPSLAAVYALTKKEKWKILAATGRNRGTRFTLSLPARI